MTQQKLIDSVWEKFSDGDHLRYLAFCDAAKAYADAETKELEEDYAELKMIHDKFYESDAVQHKQILALNAEIKRLRGAISELWNRDAISLEEMRQILSPAPVTYQPDLLTKILALPDDTSAAYIKALIHDQLETK